MATEGHGSNVHITVASPDLIAGSSSTSSPRLEEDIIAQVLNSIADQAGLETPDLNESADFGDLGIDSILTILILVEMPILTGLDLPTSLFTTHPNVSSLLIFLEGKLGRPTIFFFITRFHSGRTKSLLDPSINTLCHVHDREL